MMSIVLVIWLKISTLWLAALSFIRIWSSWGERSHISSDSTTLEEAFEVYHDQFRTNPNQIFVDWEGRRASHPPSEWMKQIRVITHLSISPSVPRRQITGTNSLDLTFRSCITVFERAFDFKIALYIRSCTGVISQRKTCEHSTPGSEARNKVDPQKFAHTLSILSFNSVSTSLFSLRSMKGRTIL